MLGDLIGCCGLTCTKCPAYLATKAKDPVKAAETARAWQQDYGVEVRVEQVWCDGCTAPGRKCAHCAECDFRTCALSRGFRTCAPCAEYPCEKLAGFFAMVPAAKATLDEIRAGG